MKPMMATQTVIMLMTMSLFSMALCDEKGGEKTTLWSSLTPLQLAAMEGRAEEVESILQQGTESLKNVVGMSPLHWAALRGHVPVIRVLLRFGADIRSLDAEGDTALHMAAVSGSSDAVQELAFAKADLDARNSNNETALHLAVGKQDFEVVKKLLRFGALTNFTDQEGRSPLDLATESHNLMIMALLQTSGAKKMKYAHDRYGTTTTTTTTAKPPKIQPPKATRRPEVRKLAEQEKKMHKAAQNNLDTVIVDLCAEEVDPNVADIDNNGYTPLHLAAANNAKTSLIALARCSANLNVKDHNGNTPLHIAVINNYPWSADILLMFGANPNITNNDGKTAKGLLTNDKNSAFIATFKPERIKWMSNVKTFTDKEQEVLRLVRKGYYLNIADSCMEGIDVRVKDANNKHYTYLHYAVGNKNNIPGTLQTLIKCGADINARDVDGNTPLHLAVTNKVSEAQRVLLLNGADPFLANGAGKTVYQMMKEYSPNGIEDRLRWYMNSMPV